MTQSRFLPDIHKNAYNEAMDKNRIHSTICPTCGFIPNRGISIDAVIVRNDQVLLVKRGLEPFKGHWATPGGYVDWDESAEDAVASEVKEETGLTVTSTQLLAVRSNPSRHPKQTINLVYLAEVAPGEAKAGDDAAEAHWFGWDEIPQDLAFDHALNLADAQRHLAH